MVGYPHRPTQFMTSTLPIDTDPHYLENSMQDFITSYFISSKIGIEITSGNTILSGVVGSELKKELVEKIIKARFLDLKCVENRLSVA